jgi:hypothetical protein
MRISIVFGTLFNISAAAAAATPFILFSSIYHAPSISLLLIASQSASTPRHERMSLNF